MAEYVPQVGDRVRTPDGYPATVEEVVPFCRIRYHDGSSTALRNASDLTPVPPTKADLRDAVVVAAAVAVKFSTVCADDCGHPSCALIRAVNAYEAAPDE